MVSKTQFAITGEDTRYFLNGALFVLRPDSMSLVATDGHRLALVSVARGTAVLLGLADETPPLRDHRDDVPLLAQHMIEELSKRHGKSARLISPEAIEALLSHHWRGNVRELRNVIERAVVICDGEQIEKRHLPFHITGQEPSPTADAVMIPIGLPLEEVERRVILSTLARSENNKTRTAETSVPHCATLPLNSRNFGILKCTAIARALQGVGDRMLLDP